MSRYTTQVRWVVEQACADAGHDPTPDHWEDAYRRLGLDDYPIFEESYRAQLNTKIIRRYYMREIGLETVGLFAFYMRERMWDVMTYYNQLYKSAELITNPLQSESMEYRELWNQGSQGTLEETTSGTLNRTGNTTNTVESATENSSRNVYSDTPMDMLQDNPSKVENLEYATNVTYDDGNTEGHTTDTGSSSTDETTGSTRSNETSGTETGNRTRSEEGYRVPQADLLKKYRETFLNIDQMVVNELGDLFMTVY